MATILGLYWLSAAGAMLMSKNSDDFSWFDIPFCLMVGGIYVPARLLAKVVR